MGLTKSVAMLDWSIISVCLLSFLIANCSCQFTHFESELFFSELLQSIRKVPGEVRIAFVGFRFKYRSFLLRLIERIFAL